MKNYFFPSNTSFIYGSLILSISVLSNSCKKAAVDTESQSAVDNSQCEAEYMTILPNVNGYAIKEQGIKKMDAGSCPAVTVTPADTITFPKTMVIDYGAGCADTSLDGKLRKGKIIAVFNKRWKYAGCTVNITFENYEVNSLI